MRETLVCELIYVENRMGAGRGKSTLHPRVFEVLLKKLIKEIKICIFSSQKIYSKNAKESNISKFQLMFYY